MAADESSADTLRLQFKAMQELQHRRLQKQMERKKEKELSSKGKADEQEGLAEIPDSLSLLNMDEQNLKSIFEKRYRPLGQQAVQAGGDGREEASGPPCKCL